MIQTFPDGPGLEIDLPGERVWSSVLTSTRDHIVGTATIATASETELLGLTLPGTATSEVVVVDRSTGELVFSAPVTDDATSTVTVGPDGSLYVTMLTLIHSFAIDAPGRRADPLCARDLITSPARRRLMVVDERLHCVRARVCARPGSVDVPRSFAPGRVDERGRR